MTCAWRIGFYFLAWRLNTFIYWRNSCTNLFQMNQKQIYNIHWHCWVPTSWLCRSINRKKYEWMHQGYNLYFMGHISTRLHQLGCFHSCLSVCLFEWREQIVHGDSWSNWLKTEIAGKHLLADYVETGATDGDKMMSMKIASFIIITSKGTEALFDISASACTNAHSGIDVCNIRRQIANTLFK